MQDDKEIRYQNFMQRAETVRLDIIKTMNVLNERDWRLSWPMPFSVAAFNFGTMYFNYIYHHTDWAMFCGIFGCVFSVRILYQYFSHRRWLREQNADLNRRISEVQAVIREMEELHRIHSDVSNSDKT